MEDVVLAQNRQSEADMAFADFDFGRSVGETSGWESASGSDEMTRPVFLDNEDGGDSERVTFVVRFRPGSAEVEEAYVSGW